MNQRNILFLFITFSLFLFSCGQNQLLGSTMTPTPILTRTPMPIATIESTPTATSSPEIRPDQLTIDWLVTDTELNSFTPTLGIERWELSREIPPNGETVCRIFLGVSMSVTPNSVFNCIIINPDILNLEDLESFLIFQGFQGLFPEDAVELDSSLEFEGIHGVYGSILSNAHTNFDLLLIIDGLAFWSSVSMGTEPGVTPEMLYDQSQERIDAFLSNIVELNLERIANPVSVQTPTQTPIPVIIVDNGHEMAFVPAGPFEIGSFGGDNDERPTQTVVLSDYYIDLYEVTNAQYAACVEGGVCGLPSEMGSDTIRNYYGNSEYDNYPVIFVSWEDANIYCSWRDARLPTEAEWEKAARGLENRVYPWGNSLNGNLLNYCDVNCSSEFAQANPNFDDGYADTAPVGSYPNGVSPYGLFDMAGNVWEWVSDWYAEDYYSTLEDGVENPSGPEDGEARVLRGGAWNNGRNTVRSSNRTGVFPSRTLSSIGFRCALSP